MCHVSESCDSGTSIDDDGSGRRQGTKRNCDSEEDIEMDESSLVPFCFRKQGEYVAAYYSTNNGHSFYIGQVMDIQSEEEAVVSFLNVSKLKEDTFKWPLSPDIEERLHSMYVFHSGVQFQTTNGRSWIVDDMNTLKKKFERFVRVYVL